MTTPTGEGPVDELRAAAQAMVNAWASAGRVEQAAAVIRLDHALAATPPPAEAWTDIPGHGDKQFLVGSVGDGALDDDAERARIAARLWGQLPHDATTRRIVRDALGIDPVDDMVARLAAEPQP